MIPEHQVARHYSLVVFPNQSWTAWRARLVRWEFHTSPVGFRCVELAEEFRDPASAAAALSKFLPSEPKEGGAQ